LSKKRKKTTPSTSQDITIPKPSLNVDKRRLVGLPDPRVVAGNLHTLRERQGLDDATFVARLQALGLSRAAAYRWVKEGFDNPTLHSLSILTRALGLGSITALFAVDAKQAMAAPEGRELLAEYYEIDGEKSAPLSTADAA
jgi:hypothetical protein